jgi:hypothetical protein
MRITLRRICPGEEYIFVADPDWTPMGGVYDNHSGARVRIMGHACPAVSAAVMEAGPNLMYPVLFLSADNFEGYAYAEELRPLVADCGLD